MSSFNYLNWLLKKQVELKATSASLHRVQEDQSLLLLASHNLPLPTQKMIHHIPYGKGMAGQAQRTLQPCITCNLPQDPQPAIQPQARHVQAQGALAYPLVDLISNPLTCIGVLGFAFVDSLPDLHSKEYQELLRVLSEYNQELIDPLRETRS